MMKVANRKAWKYMKVASFFAGIGGIDKGFEDAGFEIVWANEFNKNAAETYRLNFDNELVVDDIKNIDIIKIPNFDVLVAGFPCQAFSIAGNRKGFKDVRGNLFFELEKIIKAKKPSVIFLENVKNLVSHDNGNTFKVIKNRLEKIGYHLNYKVLNASRYANLPQNRERIYIVAFRDARVSNLFTFPEEVTLSTQLEDIIQFEEKKDSKYYYEESHRYYEKLKAEATNTESIYQWRRIYVRENKNRLCPTLTANMGGGGHNVPIINSKFGFRKLTPRECFALQGFSNDFKIPFNVAESHLYMQAGNSVVVPVIRRIASNIMNAYAEYGLYQSISTED